MQRWSRCQQQKLVEVIKLSTFNGFRDVAVVLEEWRQKLNQFEHNIWAILHKKTFYVLCVDLFLE